eukprot:scaffold2119_cov355-Prasinococcus_capsulatus_cf.AAC.19
MTLPLYRFGQVHTALLELLEPEEIQCILAHELGADGRGDVSVAGHLKCEHGVWLTAANLLGASVSELPMGGLLAANLEENLLRWLRAAELTCDRAALLVTQVRQPSSIAKNSAASAQGGGH